MDGNPSTNWTSGAGGTQWIEVDLGDVQRQRGPTQLGAAYASAYQIDVSSDGVTWTTLYSTTAGAGGVR